MGGEKPQDQLNRLYAEKAYDQIPLLCDQIPLLCALKFMKENPSASEEGNLRGERASAKHWVPATPGGQQSHSH